MEKINIKPGIVNGDIINDLISICNNWFVNPWVQPYAGANYECMFCGCMLTKSGGGHHSVADCPVMHLQYVSEKYKKFFVQKVGGNQE